MTLIDKTTYIQRLIYSIDKEQQRLAKMQDNSGARENIRLCLKEAETNIDLAIENLHFALEFVGFFPKIKEI